MYVKSAFLSLLVLCAAPCWSQSNTGIAQTNGPCSPAISGNDNKLEISCEGIPPTEMAKFVALLNAIAKRQLDVGVVMSRLDTLAGNVNEAASYASGGSSYPDVFPAPVTREDGSRQIGFYLMKRGKYPLYALKVSVGSPFRTAEDENGSYRQQLGLSAAFQEVDDDGTHPLGFVTVPNGKKHFFEVDMSARNGQWEGIIEVYKLDSGPSFRWVLFGSDDPSISPLKLILDLVDSNFPLSERHDKVYPLFGIQLPDAESTLIFTPVGR